MKCAVLLLLLLKKRKCKLTNCNANKMCSSGNKQEWVIKLPKMRYQLHADFCPLMWRGGQKGGSVHLQQLYVDTCNMLLTPTIRMCECQQHFRFQTHFAWIAKNKNKELHLWVSCMCNTCVWVRVFGCVAAAAKRTVACNSSSNNSNTGQQHEQPHDSNTFYACFLHSCSCRRPCVCTFSHTICVPLRVCVWVWVCVVAAAASGFCCDI